MVRGPSLKLRCTELILRLPQAELSFIQQSLQLATFDDNLDKHDVTYFSTCTRVYLVYSLIYTASLQENNFSQSDVG